MNEILKIAINNKLLNINDSKAIGLLSENDKSDKITNILTIEVAKFLVGLKKIER